MMLATHFPHLIVAMDLMVAATTFTKDNAMKIKSKLFIIINSLSFGNIIITNFFKIVKYLF